LGSAIPIANQYASQWLYCDAFAFSIDTGKIVRPIGRYPIEVPGAAVHPAEILAKPGRITIGSIASG
jgi:hypothetical protein